jgi:hypothetical protein
MYSEYKHESTKKAGVAALFIYIWVCVLYTMMAESIGYLAAMLR